MQMKLSKILIFSIVMMVFGLVPPEKGPDGVPPLDESTKTIDFSMAIFLVIFLLGISLTYAILQPRKKDQRRE